MVEKEQQRNILPRQTNPYGHVDVELSAVAKDLRRKKRMRCFLFIIIFIVFQTAIIALFAMTIAKFRNPKFRVRSATFTTFEVPTTNPSSFNINMNAEVSVKNTNFGTFRYRNTTVDFYYRDRKVGEGFVVRGRAKARSTSKFVVVVNLSSATNLTSSSELSNDLNSGVLPLRSQSRLRGRVKIMVVLKKNRNANMDCTMELAVAAKELQNVVCR